MNLDTSPYGDSDREKELVTYFEQLMKDGAPCCFDEDEYLTLFDHYVDSDDVSPCEVVLKWADQQYPGSIAITDCHARLLAAKGDYAGAEAIIDQALQIDSKDIDLLLTKGKLLLVRHKNDEADKIFKSLYNNEYDDPFLYGTLVDVGNSYGQVGMKDKAIKIYERAIKLTNENEEASFELALLYADQPDKLERAAELLEKVLDRNPYSTQTWLAIGGVYSDLQKYGKAVEAFDYAYTIDPQCYKALYLKGHSQMNCNQYKEALEAFEEYSDLKGEDSELCLSIGECYEALGHFGTADEKYRHAVYLDDNNVSAMIHLAMLHSEDDADDALRWILYAKDHDKENPEIWHLVGDIQCKAATQIPGNIHKEDHIAWAEKAYKKAIQLDPQNPLPMVSLGILYYDEGDYDSALYYLEQAYRLSAQVDELKLFLALTYYQLKDKEQAKKFLKMALENNPEAWNTFTSFCPKANDDPYLSEFKGDK